MCVSGVLNTCCSFFCPLFSCCVVQKKRDSVEVRSISDLVLLSFYLGNFGSCFSFSSSKPLSSLFPKQFLHVQRQLAEISQTNIQERCWHVYGQLLTLRHMHDLIFPSSFICREAFIAMNEKAFFALLWPSLPPSLPSSSIYYDNNVQLPPSSPTFFSLTKQNKRTCYQTNVLSYKTKQKVDVLLHLISDNFEQVGRHGRSKRGMCCVICLSS